MNVKIWITSWRRYNEGMQGFGWFDLIVDGEAVEWGDMRNALIQAGYDPNDFRDEEMTIHDFDVDVDGLDMPALIGEDHPSRACEVAEMIAGLRDVDALLAVIDAEGANTAYEALITGRLDDVVLLPDDDALIDYFMDAAGIDAELRHYLDTDAIKRDMLCDWNESRFGFYRWD